MGGVQVLQNCVERVIRPAEDDDPSVEVPLGLYILRGETVCVVGSVDEALDASITWSEVKGAPIGSTKH
jgi:U6 snRNA-associated Sm-like protein LSm8